MASWKSQASRKGTEYVICPYDSDRLYGYDLKLTGVNDDQAITAFLAALVGSTTDSKPALVKFQTGNINLTAEILINNSWITFEGPTRPMWRKFNSAYPSMSAPGTRGGTLLHQATAGKGIFKFGSNFLQQDEGVPRFRGIEFKRLLLDGIIGGAASSGTAIADDTSPVDRVMVDECLFMGFATGIKCGWDSPVITRNDFQSMGTGYGVWVTNNAAGGIAGALADVSHNIFFDSGIVGVRVDADGSKVVSNVFGNLNQYCVQVGARSAVVSANTVRNTYSGFCQVANFTSYAPSGVSITGNAVQLCDYNNRATAPYSTNNAHGVFLGAPSGNNDIAGCVVDGNTFTRFGTTTGFAIAMNGGGLSIPTGVRANYVGANAYDGNLGGGTGWNSGNANPNSLAAGTQLASFTTV